MATKGHMTGMLGTFLAAAELTRKGLIVTITSRNARAADLLAANQSYSKTWSIQVKTNSRPASFWLLSPDYKEAVSSSHMYLFINLRGDDRPDFYVVPSRLVAKFGSTTPVRSGGSIWHGIKRTHCDKFKNDWTVFER